MEKKDYFKIKAKELKASLKSFPSDFIKPKHGITIKLPSNSIYPGREFFGKHEITFSDGTSWRVCDNPYEAKFLIYASQNGNSEVKIPADEVLLKSSVTEYEKYLDMMMKEIKAEFLRKFPGEDDTDAVTDVLKYLNLIRY